MPNYQTYAGAATDVVWSQWTIAYTSDSTTAGTSMVWQTWTAPYTAASLTPQIITQVAHDTEWLERARIAAEERARKDAIRQKEEAEAVETAKKLLREHLSDEQRKEFDKLSSFRVIIGDKTYRIKRGIAGNVELLDAKGKPISRYCIHPAQTVPPEDNMLAQKLLLEADEKAFLKEANMTRIAVAA